MPARNVEPGAYGRAHQERRDRLVAAARAAARAGRPLICARCGKPMMLGQRLDAGHTNDRVLSKGRSVADRAEHESCNRSAGAELGNAIRAGKVRKHSRRW